MIDLGFSDPLKQAVAVYENGGQSPYDRAVAFAVNLPGL